MFSCTLLPYLFLDLEPNISTLRHICCCQEILSVAFYSFQMILWKVLSFYSKCQFLVIKTKFVIPMRSLMVHNTLLQTKTLWFLSPIPHKAALLPTPFGVKCSTCTFSFYFSLTIKKKTAPKSHKKTCKNPSKISPPDIKSPWAYI